jgi:hypothetical protein
MPQEDRAKRPAPLPVPEKYTTSADLAKQYGSRLSAGSAAMQGKGKAVKRKPVKAYAKKGVSTTLGKQEVKRARSKGKQHSYRMNERDERNAMKARLRRQNRGE